MWYWVSTNSAVTDYIVISNRRPDPITSGFMIVSMEVMPLPTVALGSSDAVAGLYLG